MYCAYALYSESLKKCYYGSTADISKRIEHHNLGLNRWTSRGVPWKLIYLEEFNSRSDALKREKFFKSGQGREFVKVKVKQ